MNNSRIINLLIGLGIVVVLLAGWFLGISPILDQVSAANFQTQSLQAANAASTARLANLKKQFANMGALEEKLLKLQDSIPYDADIPDFLAEINSLSAANGVSLTTLTVNDALTYVAPGSVAAAPTTDATAPGAATDATAPVTPAVDPTTGLVAVPVTVSISGPYTQVMAFTGALQKGTRLLFVAKLTITGAGDGNVIGKIEGNIYVLPLPAGVEPITPKPTPTPTPSPTPTPAPTPTATPEPDATEAPAA